MESVIYQWPDEFVERQKEAEHSWMKIPFHKVERVKLEDWHLTPQLTLDEIQLGNSQPYNFMSKGSKIAYCSQDYPKIQLTEQAKKVGVQVLSLDQAIASVPIILEQYLFSLWDLEKDRIAMYHLANLNAGLFIYIPKDAILVDPIEVEIHEDCPDFHSHILIVAEEGAKFEYIEHLSSSFDNFGKGSASHFTEVIVADNVNMRYFALESLMNKIDRNIRRRGRLGNFSQLNLANSVMNSGNNLVEIDVDLFGEFSEAEVSVVSIAHKEDQQIISSQVENQGRSSRGNIYQHGVATNNGRLTLNATGHIFKGAKDADAQQESRVLMLSDKARADANPILLIEEYQVTAGHAASVGQVDKEQLWYLMSRGINRSLAEQLVIRGFLGKVIKAMPTQSIREAIVKAVDAKLKSSIMNEGLSNEA